MIYFLDIWISHTFTHVRFKFIKRTSWAHLPVRIQKCTSGRAYILRFTSSDKKVFFWMQEPSTDKDRCHCQLLPSLISKNSAEVRDVWNQQAWAFVVFCGEVGELRGSRLLNRRSSALPPFYTRVVPLRVISQFMSQSDYTLVFSSPWII